MTSFESIGRGPLVELGAIRRALPFAGTALGGIFALAVTDLQQVDPFLWALALSLCLAAIWLVAPWHRLPVAAQDVPPLAFFGVVVLLREAGGGTTSGLGPMVLIPVCWVAMYSGRAALGVALAAAGGTYLVPALLIGGTAYPPSDFRRGVVMVLIGGLVGVGVQTLVRSLKDEREAATLAARQVAVFAEQLGAVAHVRHSLQVNHDPRGPICEGARNLTGADMSMLLEVSDDRGLLVTACLGANLLGATVPLDPRRSAAVDCLLTGQRIFVADARTDARIPAGLRAETNAVSVLYEPVVRRGQVVAILFVGWSSRIDVAAETGAAMTLMAVEASVALEQADLLQTVQELARTDQLTGVPNRRAFDELLPDVLSSIAAGTPLCLALLDLDLFKDYNDTFGHPAGDQFLKDATAAWTRELRGTDVLARYGGEEFAVILRDCQLEDATGVLDKLRRATPAGQTVSVGIAQWDTHETRQAFVQRVDEALYEAKAAGRNRLQCAADPVAQKPQSAERYAFCANLTVPLSSAEPGPVDTNASQPGQSKWGACQDDGRCERARRASRHRVRRL